MTASITPAIRVEIVQDKALFERLVEWGSINNIHPIPGSTTVGLRSYTAYYWASAADALNEFFATPPVVPNPECPACGGTGVVRICTHEPPCWEALDKWNGGKNEMPCLCVLKQRPSRRQRV